MVRTRALLVLAGFAALALASVVAANAGSKSATKTPIKHVVVIFQENVSFDHYFATYPKAANTDGETFTPLADTPKVNGLSGSLLTANPNAANPQRLASTVAGQLTCDQDHNYNDEQRSFDGGKTDKFVETVGNANGVSPTGAPCDAKTVMDYYDGNTVTALWNYAQHFAMSDNSYGTTFGPSSPGAISLVAGDTGNVDTAHEANNPSIASSTSPNADLTADGLGGYSLTSDAQPYWDDCSTRDAVALHGKNIGDELNAAGLSWGWFEGGFTPSISYTAALNAIGVTQGTSTFVPDQFKTAGFQTQVAHSSNQGICDSVHPVGIALGGTGQYGYKDDYIPHHEPFQYYASTANPHHLAPASLNAIGTDTQTYANGVPQFDTANHNYDTSDFDQLLSAITAGQLPASALPAVSFLKAPGYQDGHAAYSDPADEQAFVTREIDALMKSPDWSSTVVLINYDDSDGWYDHAYPGVQNPSTTVADSGCTASIEPLAGEQGRCGFGPRLPMIAISPFAKRNFVDHSLSDQASIINFVEYNWRLPAIAGSADHILRKKPKEFDLENLFDFKGKGEAKKLILNPKTGK
ncbi:MAG TPA: alkaline phosphatase family protein [Gaiellaceae bacterium]|nr:alkaline phosphatase family protein [Gaiellaceae bacterium]